MSPLCTFALAYPRAQAVLVAYFALLGRLTPPQTFPIKMPYVRIVFLNPVAEFGGAERSLLAWLRAVQLAFPVAALTLIVPGDGLLSKRAREAGVDVQVLPIPPALAGLGDSSLRRDGSPTGRALRLGHLAWRAARSGPAVWLYSRRLRKLLQDLRPELLHSNGIKSHLALRLASLGGHSGTLKVPVIWHLHDFIGQRPVVAKALRWASGNVAAAVGVSKAVATDGRSVLPHVPVSTVYNVVDLERFGPGPGDGTWLDELAGMPAAETGTVRVVLVATYARWKGQDVLLEAATVASRDTAAPPLRFYIVGGPIYRTHGSQFSESELRARAAQLGVASRVGFIAFQDEPADVYRAADVVVHASTQPEPFGLTIVEAMACGRAVVVSNAGGAAELFTHGHDGIAVSPGDHASLSTAIIHLALDAEMRARIGSEARRTVAERFNAWTLPARVSAIYKQVVSGVSKCHDASGNP